MSLKPVTSTDGTDLTAWISDAAKANGLDAVHLLALLKAESNLNTMAERWGTQTAAAKNAIAVEAMAALQVIIDAQWPDISFGVGQNIVLYSDLGNHTRSVANVLAVREAVFADPAADILRTAAKLAGCFLNRTCDGTPISALCIYNAGSDRRSDPAWMAAWAGNVASYERALVWAEGYRETEEGSMTADQIAQLTRIAGVVQAWGAYYQQRGAAATGAGIPDGLADRTGQELGDLAAQIREQLAAG